MLEKFSKKQILIYLLAWPAWVIGGFVFAQVLVFGFLWMLKELGMDLRGIESPMAQALVTTVSYLLALLLVVGLPKAIKKDNTSLSDMGIKGLPEWRDLLLALAGFVIYFVSSVLLVTLASQFLPWFDADQTQEIGFNQLVWRYEYLIAFVTLVIIIPIAEEVLFRGYLYSKIRKFIPAWGAIVLTSALFALVHGAWNVAFDVFALGVVLAVLREFTKSLWAPVLLHMAKNGLAFYFLFINPALSATLG